MRDRKNAPPAKNTSGFVIGRARFAKISAVEGIALSADMQARAEQADRDGLSRDERRKAIIDKHQVLAEHRCMMQSRIHIATRARPFSGTVWISELSLN